MSANLSWEQKLAAIMAVSLGACVKMRAPADWYVSASMEHAHGASMLIGDYGNGFTPDLAVEDHWKLYADGTPFLCDGQWFRWNGFMWEPSKRPEHPATDPQNLAPALIAAMSGGATA